MAKGFAIHNAITDHGGVIPSTQMRTSQMGNLFVRAGDGHMCPKCRCWSVVIKSHDHIIMDGKPVAYAGDKLSCGATIQPQQSHVVGDSGSPYSRSSENTNTSSFVPTLQYGQRFLLQDELTGEPLSNVCYEIEKSGNIIHGKTDENGFTDLITSENKEEIQIHIIYEEHDHG
ncbi:PAAR domain-containing protein [Acinetobacter baumannii]|uniref:PAAR domain-containing protein n=1 Tax=Acinetobacter baumannii TaxID=470 RepID=UPI00234044B4|nr:PAAR domain-containing protein [Acinetobacter baumannii]MDC5642762.1 PAAR domain-containing protein [Acinetobacter baumannii]MDH2535558.1 PAAR domain-containing protein [Acinetobacter baumannii]